MTVRKFLTWFNFILFMLTHEYFMLCADASVAVVNDDGTTSSPPANPIGGDVANSTKKWWDDLPDLVAKQKQKEREQEIKFLKRDVASSPRHRDIVAAYNLSSIWGDKKSDNFAFEAPRANGTSYWRRWEYMREEFELPLNPEEQKLVDEGKKLDKNAVYWRYATPKDDEYAKRPLLSLVMIVKNEAESIEHTIASVKPYVDRYTIIDTFSDDGTPDLIRKAFGDTPGDIYFEKFVNFEATRNRALELEGTKSVFSLMLSGDESVLNGDVLRTFCEAKRKAGALRFPDDEGFNVKIVYSTDVYDSTRLVRTDAQWFYTGVTHEYMTNGNRQIARRRAEVKGTVVEVYHDLSKRDHAAKKRAWARDLELLKTEWDRNPNRTRTAFYIGQSHECLDQFAEAYEWYERRFAMGGWFEEAYEAKYRMARCADAMKKPWAEVQGLYLDAHSYLPARAEPLYYIAEHWFHNEDDMPLSYLFLLRARAIPFPKLKLFIQADVYNILIHELLAYAAYYMKDYKTGFESLLQALRYDIKDTSLAEVVGFYEELAYDLPSDLAHLSQKGTWDADMKARVAALKARQAPSPPTSPSKEDRAALESPKKKEIDTTQPSPIPVQDDKATMVQQLMDRWREKDSK